MATVPMIEWATVTARSRLPAGTSTLADAGHHGDVVEVELPEIAVGDRRGRPR